MDSINNKNQNNKKNDFLKLAAEKWFELALSNLYWKKEQSLKNIDNNLVIQNDK